MGAEPGWQKISSSTPSRAMVATSDSTGGTYSRPTSSKPRQSRYQATDASRSATLMATCRIQNLGISMIVAPFTGAERSVPGRLSLPIVPHPAGKGKGDAQGSASSSSRPRLTLPVSETSSFRGRKPSSSSSSP